ncbi:MAG TPA: c-type cytochrome [Terriglobia bacterium]|nr:c-type cytochrome [Terriglobia bacterium]
MSQRIQVRRPGRLFLAPLIAAVMMAWAAPLPAQTKAQAPVKIKKVPVQQNNEISGEKLFQANCAVCHGRDGKGNGPAEPALKAVAPDLTLLTKLNGNKFPSDFVMSVLNNGWTYAGHGSKDMPIWGPLFRSMASGSDAQGKLRATNVLEYLKSIQQK